MKIFNYKQLNVWKKSYQLTLKIYKLTGAFPREELFGITSQLRRSSASIGANIAEGYKRSRKEFLQFLRVAEGSLEETKYHLQLSKDLNYCEVEKYKLLSELADEIGRMLSGLMRSIQQK